LEERRRRRRRRRTWGTYCAGCLHAVLYKSALANCVLLIFKVIEGPIGRRLTRGT